MSNQTHKISVDTECWLEHKVQTNLNPHHGKKDFYEHLFHINDDCRSFYFLFSWHSMQG